MSTKGSKTLNKRLLLVLGLILTACAGVLFTVWNVNATHVKTARLADYALESKEEKVTILFYRDDCPYCSALMPYIDELEHKTSAQKIISVSTNNQPGKSLAVKYKIKTVPTMVLSSEPSKLYSVTSGSPNNVKVDRQLVDRLVK